MPGDEREPEFKLSHWDKFVLAQGVAPALMRTLAATTIIGGTLVFSVLQVLS